MCSICTIWIDKNFDCCIFESWHQKGANKVIRNLSLLGNLKETKGKQEVKLNH